MCITISIVPVVKVNYRLDLITNKSIDLECRETTVENITIMGGKTGLGIPRWAPASMPTIIRQKGVARGSLSNLLSMSMHPPNNPISTIASSLLDRRKGSPWSCKAMETTQMRLSWRVVALSTITSMPLIQVPRGPPGKRTSVTSIKSPSLKKLKQ